MCKTTVIHLKIDYQSICAILISSFETEIYLNIALSYKPWYIMKSHVYLLNLKHQFVSANHLRYFNEIYSKKLFECKTHEVTYGFTPNSVYLITWK